jgi:16S rRNA (guanine966-N2)-methyltransferase
MKKAGNRRHKGTGSVRIIAGDWRGSRLPVPDLPGLRPSGDRCRETLFSWLQPLLHDAVCVDLFAGSGALGMEAASRGARRVMLVEKLRQAAVILQENVDRLGAGQVEVIISDALQWLHDMPPHSLDIAFIDPPFGLGLESRALELLHIRDGMKHGGCVYVETARSASVPLPGPGWELAREKVIGDVKMLLFKKIE